MNPFKLVREKQDLVITDYKFANDLQSIIVSQYLPDLQIYDTFYSLMLGLGYSAKSLLFWIFVELKTGEDLFHFKRSKFMTDAGISLNSMKKGLKELEDKGIVAVSEVRSYYYINLNYFSK